MILNHLSKLVTFPKPVLKIIGLPNKFIFIGSFIKRQTIYYIRNC